MSDLFGSFRRSISFRANPNSDEAPNGRFTEKIGSCLRKSRVGIGNLGLGLGFLPKFPSSSPPTHPIIEEDEDTPPIRWRKGELIGSGAFGHVYMGMNLDSGELLAVKQVLIGANCSSKEKAQAHIRELEEEVKLLRNLSHPNIVRYLGTAREDNTLNILLEFVPGGSIYSLLGKFGSFPESVIITYTKQLLQGLEYLHCNKIIHRDIKGANILVDNKGCIKLADFGASKKVAQLATMNAAKSMKGTPYWMAPEVIVQSGHSFSADIWSVGCTVIEMATGKAPWSQQYQEVAALFHVGTTKSHPPIPEHLSSEAKDFLLKCLQEEPNLRPTASDLLQHPFVTGEKKNTHPLYHSKAEPYVSNPHQPGGRVMSNHNTINSTSVTSGISRSFGYDNGTLSLEKPLRPMWETSTSDDMCQFDDKDDFPMVGSSFNPMSEPLDDWSGKFDMSPEPQINLDDFGESMNGPLKSVEKEDFAFPCDSVCEDSDEVTETKIRAFLDAKALDLKKLQTPLFEEFFNTSSPSTSYPIMENVTANNSKLPPKGKPSPNRVVSGGGPSAAMHVDTGMYNSMSPARPSRRLSSAEVENSRVLKEIHSPQNSEMGENLQGAQQEPHSPSATLRKWKEELDQELEMMRQAAMSGKASSPKDGRGLNRKRDHIRFTG